MLFDIEVAINETYSSEMSDNSTEEFRSIAQLFCNQIDAVDQNVSSFTYEGCLVTSLGNGSITVTVMWNLVLEITDDNQPYNTTILEKFGLEEQELLGSFLISKPTIIHSSKQISANEIATFSRRDFNQKCTFGQSCRAVFSDCINNTCTCPDHRLFNVSTGTCTLAE
ncbi:uncharacterized protein LOC132734851 [Ruditapes philippinarum]|uniref:uncharacterized protein LOC132734851 n=1 Tax=Ruditapes philippinarum TaxID=129788 RepID=UPI00295B0B8A|nr:uncharacterized protein LOC132734851 [Ruditapes philippinarum]